MKLYATSLIWSANNTNVHCATNIDFIRVFYVRAIPLENGEGSFWLKKSENPHSENQFLCLKILFFYASNDNLTFLKTKTPPHHLLIT